jgi:CheY-like chemotaxis protein
MSAEADRLDYLGPIRILVTDDNAAIHEDFRKILAADSTTEADLRHAESLLFGDAPAAPAARETYALDFALQGQQAVNCVERARTEGRPYALAFVDMRMPPGWDGLETIEHLWEKDPDVQVVICSAHSDYDWMDVVERLGHSV